MGKRKVTPANQWREPREKGYLVTLPSGNVARMRPVALDVMILDGTLPDLLSPIAAKTLWTETDIEEIGNIGELAAGMAELFGHVCRASFLEPRIADVEDLGEGEIALDDVSFDDKAFVFQLAIQPAQVLRKFCEQQAAGVGTVRTGDDDTPETE
jgi:hypothetical protein